MLDLFFRLLPTGPQKDAAQALYQGLKSDPASLAVLTAHFATLKPLVGEVQAGSKTPAEALTAWLEQYNTLAITDRVRALVADLINSISEDPAATNAAVGPALPMVAPFLK